MAPSPYSGDRLDHFLQTRSTNARCAAHGIASLAGQLEEDVFSSFRAVARARVADLERIAKVYEAIAVGREARVAA